VPQEAHEAAERRGLLIGQRVKEHMPPLEEVPEVVGILGIGLPPGAVQRAAVVVGHLGRDEHHIDPVAFQEGGERLVVGARRLHRAHDLDAPGLLLPPLQVHPEGREAALRVGDAELLVQDPGVGETDLGHVLGLRDVDPHEEPVALGPEVRLQFPKALDSDCI
jgi:hypothetical protein